MTSNDEGAMRSVAAWKSVLRDALRDAQRARRALAVAVLRETLAAIDNAEAADLSVAPTAQHGVIAGGVAGLGAGEVARRVLTAQEVAALIEWEIEERRTAAAAYEAHGRAKEADALRSQIDLLVALL
jgi:uncharacterized protein